MIEKIKNTISNIDRFFYKKFGSYKSTKPLENIKEAQKIFSYLKINDDENNVRFVGGCVRKAVYGENIDDIDLATSLKPEEVKTKLAEKNIKVIDTGIYHGTVTIILNKKKFEITTLRKDVSTDGRHANVEFTSNWNEDALRRDFTINAIYADMDGRIFDPQNGITDLKNGKIKFIGSAEERIQEDYLRILRYIRFFTQYSNSDHDQNTIKFIKQNINGLAKISNERMFDELKKILLLKNINELFLKEQSREIVLNIFPQIKYYERLKIFNNLDQKFKSNYDVNLILALLLLDETNDYEYFCHKYKTSNVIKRRFKNISVNLENLKSKKFYSKENIKKLIYLSNKDEVKDLLLFSMCAIDVHKLKLNNSVSSYKHIEALLHYVNICKIPKFPVSGDYLKEQGYKAGEALGKKLKSLEEKWIDNNFVINNKMIEKSLGKTLKN